VAAYSFFARRAVERLGDESERTTMLAVVEINGAKTRRSPNS